MFTYLPIVNMNLKNISLNYCFSSSLSSKVNDSRPPTIKLMTLHWTESNSVLLKVTFMQKQSSTDLQVDDGPKLAEMLVEFADVVKL